MIAVDRISWYLSVDSMSSSVLAGLKSVATSVTPMQTRIPTAVIIIG